MLKFRCTAENGRFVVRSLRTGKTYAVEALGGYSNWGDVDPATKKLTGSYGSKHKGSIEESESLIKEENNFCNIRYTGTGVSPFDVIDEMDSRYPSI